MILGEDNRKRWSNLDVLIMQAYQIVQDERCDQCHLPRWLCHNEDGRLQVKLVEDDCYVKQEMKRYDEQHKDDKETPSVYPEFYSIDGTPLVEFRALYYEQLAQKAAEAAEAAEDED